MQLAGRMPPPQGIEHMIYFARFGKDTDCLSSDRTGISSGEIATSAAAATAMDTPYTNIAVVLNIFSSWVDSEGPIDITGDIEQILVDCVK